MDRLIQQAQELAKKSLLPILSIPKRIAYVVSHGQSYASNGYAIRTQGIAEALNAHGFEALCFVRPGRPWELSTGTTIDPEVQVKGVRYIHTRHVAGLKTNDEQALLEADVAHYIEMFNIYRPEVVLAASNYKVGLPAWIAAQRLGLPFYNEVRGFWELSKDAREPGYAKTPAFNTEAARDTFVAQQAARVFTLNQPMKDELIRRGVDGNKIELVPNGVSELPEIKVADPGLKKRLGIKDTDKVIGYIGSFSPYEGLDLLIEACNQLVDEGESIKLLLVGDDQPITTDIELNSVFTQAPWLIQVGRVPHETVGDYYALVDLVVIPRKAHRVCELVPSMKAVEALSYGKRVLSSDVSVLSSDDREKKVSRFKAENIDSLKRAINMAYVSYFGEDTISLDFGFPDAFFFSLGGNKNNLNLNEKIKDELRGKLKVVSIMDEISEECWLHEMTIFPISRKKYQEQIRGSSADFCFLESCWKGNKGAWEYAFTSPEFKHDNAKALLDLIPIVKEKMPLIFWNKEDPMHYDRYLPIAKSADIIFTTDEHKLLDYKRDVPNAKIYAVPFAAQQKICNPSDRFRIEPESVCFAGSYYGEGHEERKRQMDALLPSIIDFNGAIYDRFSKLKDERYQFPPHFQPFIRDAVPFSEVVKLYKRFKVFLNVNTIVDSPTMMSRRVYELLACGTPVISTPSKAIEEQFSGIVQVANSSAEANVIINKLLTDSQYWEKISHLGYRLVMTKHTYSHRLEKIKESLGYSVCSKGHPLISIVTCTKRPTMIDRIVENMTRQNHPNCELILVLQDFSKEQCNELLRKLRGRPSNIIRMKIIINNNAHITLGDRLNIAVEYAKGEYIAKMDDDDFYFKNYLSDMLLPFSFGDYGMVGKKELFMYLSGSNKLIKRFPGMKHQEVDFVAGPTFLIKKEIFNNIKFESRNTGEDSSFIKNIKDAGYRVYAADPFNFIQFRSDPKNHTWGITDDEILRGKQTKLIDNYLNTGLCDF